MLTWIALLNYNDANEMSFQKLGHLLGIYPTQNRFVSYKQPPPGSNSDQFMVIFHRVMEESLCQQGKNAQVN